MVRPLLLSAVMGVVLLTGAEWSTGASVTWTNAGGNGLWSDRNNWSPSVVPQDGDSVIVANSTIDLGGVTRPVNGISARGAVTLANGTLSSGAVWTTSNSTATLTANVTANGPRVQISKIGFNNTLNFAGRLVGNGYRAELTNVVVTNDNPFAGRTEITGITTLSGNGRLNTADILHYATSILELDNSGSVLQDRLRSDAVIRHQDPFVGRLRLVGNATQSVVQNVGTIAIDSGPLLISVQSNDPVTQLNAAQLTRGPNSVLAVALNGAGARLTTSTLPELVGGTGGTQTPIVPFSVAATLALNSGFTATGFLTYDQTPTAGGGTGAAGVGGYRAVRPDEFVNSLAAAAPLDNVRLVSTSTSLASSKTINALALTSDSNLDLADADLTLTSGGLMNDGTLTGATPGATIRSTGSGRLRSARPLQVIAAANAEKARPLVLSAPVSAPSMTIIGPGSVTLDAINDLPGGVLTAGVVTIARPEAIGSGPLIDRGGSLKFVGSQTLANTLVIDRGAPRQGGLVSGGDLYTIDPNSVVTFNGPMNGIGGVANSGGLLRLMGGGRFNGSLGSFNVSNPAGASNIEVGGTWTIDPILIGGLIARGNIFGNATIPLSFEHGTISAGAPSAIGVLSIANLAGGSPTFVDADRTTVLVDVAGSAADLLIVNTAPKFGELTFRNFALSIHLIEAPAFGTTYTIIRNDTNVPAISPFIGLPENAVVTTSGYQFRVSYIGGDGNDVTLTAVPEPLTGGLIAGAMLLIRRRR